MSRVASIPVPGQNIQPSHPSMMIRRIAFERSRIARSRKRRGTFSWFDGQGGSRRGQKTKSEDEVEDRTLKIGQMHGRRVDNGSRDGKREHRSAHTAWQECMGPAARRLSVPQAPAPAVGSPVMAAGRAGSAPPGAAAQTAGIVLTMRVGGGGVSSACRPGSPGVDAVNRHRTRSGWPVIFDAVLAAG